MTVKQSAMPSTSRIQFANAARGIAAIVVMLAHYTGFWLHRDRIAEICNFPPLATGQPVTPHYMLVVSSTHPFVPVEFGVALFFLVSGFVVPFSFGTYDRHGFLIGRFLRLYPTYFAGFSVTVMAVLAGSIIYGRPFPYSAGAVLIHALPGLRDITWSPHIDYVVWTLEVELKFYLLCVAVAPLLRAGSKLVFLAPVATAAISIAASFWLPERGAMPHLAGAGIFVWQVLWAVMFSGPMLVFMFIGVTIHYRYRGIISDLQAACLALSLFLVFCLMPMGRIYEPGFAIAGSVSFGAAVLVFATCAALPDKLFASRGLGWAASISYPLYIVHGIAGYILMRVLAGAGVGPSFCMLIAVVAATCTATLIHYAVEQPTHRLGQRLARRFSRPPVFTAVSTAVPQTAPITAPVQALATAATFPPAEI